MALTAKHVVISFNELESWLLSHFDGWHHTHANVHGVSKTTLAVVPDIASSETEAHRTIQATVDRLGARFVGPLLDDGDALAVFMHLLHNRGLTLQTRPDHMVLTRTLKFLVKGTHAAHVATICQLQNCVCLTEAFKTIEATVMTDVRSRAADVGREVPARPGAVTLAMVLQPNKSPDSIAGMVDLCVRCRRRFPSPLAVNDALSAAVMLTGVSDAGAKFRDRAARSEGARHYGESIMAMLRAPLEPL